MNIEYDPEGESVWVDGIEYNNVFTMPTYLRDEFSTEDWLSINQFLFAMDNQAKEE
jgi:hypothetical protein